LFKYIEEFRGKLRHYQTVASLDEISAGRVILGLGTSGPIVIENWPGLPFERPQQAR
jgi:alkanesulfonate monooxygenase SsuD/methylene tetrahydromethanopterin reductase-like flavin-dependent oxidoreductase (luciferase family)